MVSTLKQIKLTVH